MLSAVKMDFVKSSSAAVAKADGPQQPRPHLRQRPFPRHTRSFFWRAEKPPRRTGTPAPPSADDGESRANCGPRNGPAPGHPWPAGSIAQYSSANGSAANNGRAWVGGANGPDNNGRV